ncbi:hypothetical protein C3B55_00215 [Candidatus Pseudomonas adelgestsugas]|uniref:Uncharacterized protein n=1 Tax=Candidatus Pseudomonas adelgestsugas TaxID=1302376 RepID=A0ABX5R7Q0_9PSED|nr:hypothetical protein C3B55_00215 [Candidatus Pseudomonas adelgestsugas]
MAGKTTLDHDVSRAEIFDQQIIYITHHHHLPNHLLRAIQ